MTRNHNAQTKGVEVVVILHEKRDAKVNRPDCVLNNAKMRTRMRPQQPTATMALNNSNNETSINNNKRPNNKNLNFKTFKMSTSRQLHHSSAPSSSIDLINMLPASINRGPRLSNITYFFLLFAPVLLIILASQPASTISTQSQLQQQQQPSDHPIPNLPKTLIKLDKYSRKQSTTTAPASRSGLATPISSTNINNNNNDHQNNHYNSSSDLILVPINNNNYSNMTRVEKVCIGTSNRLSGQLNKIDHYQLLAERYRNCTYVMGNLEITWIEKSSSDLSFLENIREITGYLLIAGVKVDRIRMPNLQIIRGRDLFKINNQKEDYAMFLIQNDLKSLELPNLREILTGSVGFFDNVNLRYERSIDWDEILNPPYQPVFSYNSSYEVKDVVCDSTCPRQNCWGEGPELCQKFSKITCSPQCSKGRCYGSEPRECCHLFCAGGCTGPKQTDCLACKNFYNDGECIQECPSIHKYDSEKFIWTTNENGRYAFGATCVKECPDHLLRDNGACVRSCPPNKKNVNGECVSCTGPCPKNCIGVDVVNSRNIDQFINCTVIEGSLKILDQTFNGYYEFRNNNVVDTIEPMHPSRLDVFKTIREITGYLSVQANHSAFKDLSYFKNLKIIGGRELNDRFCSLEIIKTSLNWLGLQSLTKVRSNKITIEENKNLCLTDTIDWFRANITKIDHITIRNNADLNDCRKRNLTCHSQCTRDGCWGPGQDQCLTCHNYRLDDYCVDNCTSTKSIGFLSYDNGDKTCHKCHPECKTGCYGPGANNCNDCKNAKDGAHCVSECPLKKYNDRGYCRPCHDSCLDRCTGPSNKLGDGGCTNCGKAIINLTNNSIAHCLKSDENCPHGYYQEYVSPQLEALIKLPIGRPVCRKCHHRCKSCHGMGTHTSVCECNKYVVGEQCEDSCPRDYYADEKSNKCNKCSHECNGCFGPSVADCQSCKVFRIYTDDPTGAVASPLSAESVAQKLVVDKTSSTTQQQGGTQNLDQNSRLSRKFNCTSVCPADKPHRVSDSSTMDPYCSDDSTLDIENARLITPGSIAVILPVIFVSFGVCFAVYKMQEKYKTVQKLTMRLSGFDEDVEPLNKSNVKPNLAPLRSIKETELRKGKVLGSGFGGTVFQGLWYPEGSQHKQPRPVAIKVLRDKGSNMNKEFLDEAYIMASVNHPNLVRLLAVCMTPTQLMLVTHLMPLGCLLDYVEKNRDDIGSKNLFEWSKQIARGMAYLEEHRMVHRDLALRNVLLQKSGRALVTDFGLAKFLDVDQSEYHSNIGGRLPVRWLAPECIRERKFTHKSDVWAFGVTVWELLTFGKRPFDEYKSEQVFEAIEKGARLSQPSYMSAEVYKVLYACWFYNPEERPDFKGLVQNFVNFARDPERYLICHTKGIDYSMNNIDNTGKNSDCDENLGDEFNMAINDFSDDSQPPSASVPELTPSTHNRLNDMQNVFNFLELRNGAGNIISNDSESDTQQQVTTPLCKSRAAQFTGSPRRLIDDDFSKNFNRTHAPPPIDLNNNITSSNAGSLIWPRPQNISTNSLARKSDQPTDGYDYLIPSPATAEIGNELTQFPAFKSMPITPTSSKMESMLPLRDPPHSAGPIGVNNDEYFLNRGYYVNYKDNVNNNHAISMNRLSASNNNIPHSLV